MEERKRTTLDADGDVHEFDFDDLDAGMRIASPSGEAPVGNADSHPRLPASTDNADNAGIRRTRSMHDLTPSEREALYGDNPFLMRPQLVPQSGSYDTAVARNAQRSDSMEWDDSAETTGGVGTWTTDGEQQFELAVDKANENVGYEWERSARHGMSRKTKAYMKMITVIVLTVVVVFGAIVLCGRSLPDYDGYNRQQAIAWQERNNAGNKHPSPSPSTSPSSHAGKQKTHHD